MAEHPCKICLVRAVCTQFKEESSSEPHEGDILNRIGNKCPSLKDYINLVDLDIEMPPEDMPMEARAYFNIPHSIRVIETLHMFHWTDHYELQLYKKYLPYYEQ